MFICVLIYHLRVHISFARSYINARYNAYVLSYSYTYCIRIIIFIHVVKLSYSYTYCIRIIIFIHVLHTYYHIHTRSAYV